MQHVARVLLRAAVVVAAVSASFIAPASAADLLARGPVACPDAGELVFRLERRLGAPLVRSAPLSLRVVFEPPLAGGAHYTARLSVRDEHGTSSERVLSAPDCDGLGDAVAVAITLAIGDAQPAAREPSMAAPAPVSEPHDAPRATTAASASGDGGVLPSPGTGRDPTRWTPVLALSGVVDAGSLPAPALGVGLEAALRHPYWALRVGGTLLFDRHVGIRNAAGAPGAELRFLVGNLSACVVPLGSYHTSSALFACAGWELGQLTAEGTGVSAPRESNQLWSAPRLDAGLSVAVPDTAFRLSLQLTAAAPLKRDDFFLRDLGNVHQVPWAVGRFALAADVAF
jgi:hypothetical protein